jgi:hypothetical protein
MPFAGIQCKKGNLTFKECAACKDRCFSLLALEIKNKQDEEYMRGRPPRASGTKITHVSVTALSGCLRKSYYETLLPWYISPVAIAAGVKGTMLHEQIAKHFAGRTDVLSEYKMKWKGALEVTGTLDLYRCPIIFDYKTGKGVKPKYVKQLNIYRKMLVDKEVTKLKIILLDQFFKTEDVPIIEIDLEERVTALAEAYATQIPPKPEFAAKDCDYCFFTKECASA